MTRHIDMTDSVANLKWNTEHHYAHIEQQHEFIRAIAVQFEIGYSDYRYIQMALYLENKDDLLQQFTKAYKDFYAYESVFAMRGLEEFNKDFSWKMGDFREVKDKLLNVLDLL